MLCDERHQHLGTVRNLANSDFLNDWCVVTKITLVQEPCEVRGGQWLWKEWKIPHKISDCTFQTTFKQSTSYWIWFSITDEYQKLSETRMKCLYLFQLSTSVRPGFLHRLQNDILQPAQEQRRGSSCPVPGHMLEICSKVAHCHFTLNIFHFGNFFSLRMFISL